MKQSKEKSKNYTIMVWGEYALFTRPENKVESVSYPIPTYSAMRNLLQHIYWHPGISYVVDKIEVMTPIQYETIKVNEVPVLATKNHLNEPIDIAANRGQRTKRYLRNVSYRLSFHFTFEVPKEYNNPDPKTVNVQKYQHMLEQALSSGRPSRDTYFGTRECTAFFGYLDEYDTLAEPIPEDLDVGFMFYDWDFDNPRIEGKSTYYNPKYTQIKMAQGVVDYTKIKEGDIHTCLC